MKKILFLLCFAVLGYFAYSYVKPTIQKYLPSEDGQRAIPLSDYRTVPATIGNKKYVLYVAETEGQRALGLSNISKLRSDQGMIFVFKNKQQLSFWMKEMRFNLDFVFLDGKTITDIRENVAPETYPAFITGQKAGDKAIELPAGQIQSSGLQIGDSIAIQL